MNKIANRQVICETLMERAKTDKDINSSLSAFSSPPLISLPGRAPFNHEKRFFCSAAVLQKRAGFVFVFLL